MLSTAIAKPLEMELMASKLSTSTKVSLGSNNQSKKACCPSKAPRERELRIKTQTAITSLTGGKIRISKQRHNHMVIAYPKTNNSSRRTSGPNRMVKTCLQNRIKVRKAEQKLKRRSLKMHILNYRSKWELSRQNSRRISSSTRRIFLSSWTVTRFMQNWWRYLRSVKLSMNRWRKRKVLSKNQQVIIDWALIPKLSNQRIPVLNQLLEAM